MLCYSRIKNLKDIDFNKTSAPKEFIILSFLLFLDKGFNFQ